MKRLPLTASLLLAATAGYAVINYDFDNGGGTGDWNLNTNWNAATVALHRRQRVRPRPRGGEQNHHPGLPPTNPTINEVGLAHTGNGTATVNHTGGSLTVQS